MVRPVMMDLLIPGLLPGSDLCVKGFEIDGILVVVDSLIDLSS